MNDDLALNFFANRRTACILANLRACLIIAVFALFFLLSGLSNSHGVVIFDTTDGVTEYTTFTTQITAAVDPHTSNPKYTAVGMAFTVPSGSYIIESVYVPIFWISGAKGLSLRLYSESVEGLPDSMIAEIVSPAFDWPDFYSPSGEQFGTLINLSEEIILEGNSRYWLAAFPNQDGLASQYGWRTTPLGVLSRTTDNGWDVNYDQTAPTGIWQNSFSIPDFALAVSASPVPEPASALLLLIAVAVGSFLRGKKSEPGSRAIWGLLGSGNRQVRQAV